MNKLHVTTGTGVIAQRGLTLVELMMVLAVMAVLLTVGVPTFQNTVKNNRLSAELSALRATLANARSEAMARRLPVRVCESTNGTSCSSTSEFSDGYIAYADENNDDVVNAGEDVFLSLQLLVPESFSIELRDSTGTVASSVRFGSRGDSIGSSGTFTFCDDRGASYAGALILSPSGSVRGATDTDSTEDGIVNGLGGANVSC